MSTKKLSRQEEIIVSALRDLRWHCGCEWLNAIKDDRRRITTLNRGYMRERGYQIIGEACRGTACGNPSCPLFKRKAVKLAAIPTDYVSYAKEMCRRFDAGLPAGQVFA